MTRILLFKPSTKPKETFSSDWMKAAIPSQWFSIISANSSNGRSRCHFKEDRQLSKNFLAQPSFWYSHNWEKDSFRRYATFNRLFAFNKVRKANRPSVSRFSRRESNVYFCPLTKRRSFPESRVYSLLRTLSRATFR